MARGWESKSVESQLEDAGSLADRGKALTPEQREIEAKRASLDLSRRRVLQELQATRSALGRTAFSRLWLF